MQPYPPVSGSRLAGSPAWHGLPQCPGCGHWVSYCWLAFVVGSGLRLVVGFVNPCPSWLGSLVVVFGLGLWCCPSFAGCLWCSWLGFGVGLLSGPVWFRARFPCPPPFPVPVCGVGVRAGPGSRLCPALLGGVVGVCVVRFFFFFSGCLVSLSRALWSLPPSPFFRAGPLAFFFCVCLFRCPFSRRAAVPGLVLPVLAGWSLCACLGVLSSVPSGWGVWPPSVLLAGGLVAVGCFRAALPGTHPQLRLTFALEEADAVLAELCRTQDAIGVLSNDTDFLLYEGCALVPLTHFPPPASLPLRHGAASVAAEAAARLQLRPWQHRLLAGVGGSDALPDRHPALAALHERLVKRTFAKGVPPELSFRRAKLLSVIDFVRKKDSPRDALQAVRHRVCKCEVQAPLHPPPFFFGGGGGGLAVPPFAFPLLALALWLVCGVVGPSPLLAEVPVCYSPEPLNLPEFTGKDLSEFAENFGRVSD